MNGNLARWATGLAVLTVAVIAAIVSFTHIEALALANGYSLATARLLPFSVDGLIVASSLSLATGGRTALSRTGLVLGVLATVLANVVFGVRFGITGAVVNSWPAVSFIVSSEILVGMLRGSQGVPVVDAATGTVADAGPAMAGDVADSVAVNATGDAPAGTVSPVPDHTVRTVAGVPQGDPDTVPASVPSPVPRVAPAALGRRSPKRAPAGRPKPPERVFRAELAAGELPSLREVMRRMSVGAPRARVIRDELARLVDEAQPAAA